MELETPSQQVAEVAGPDPVAEGRRRSAAAWTFAFFVLFWALFYALQQSLPYLKNGSDIVMSAKIRFEQTGQIFPSAPNVQRVMIFGNSKVLAGFLPSLFDRMASAGNLNVSSFNSGFPGSDEFLSEFKAVCAHGQAPNVIFLTLPWRPDPPKHNLFHLIQDDHAVAEELFPFRFWLRDFTSFLMGARSHGGVMSFYQESKNDAQRMIGDRGYYLITEQSHFPGGRIPDNFHLATDQPGSTALRYPPPPDADSQELDRLVRQYHMRCYYVPYYLRIGEAAPPPERDRNFAHAVESATPCKLLGPDYFLYPNHLFSDQTHLNTAGARVYTQALFQLVKSQLSHPSSSQASPQISQGQGHALQ